MLTYYTPSEKESLKYYKTSIKIARRDIRNNNAAKDRALFKMNDILLRTIIRSQKYEIRMIKRIARNRLMKKIFKRK